MSLSTLRRSQQAECGRWSVLRSIHERNMDTARNERVACITELQSGTVTEHTEDGVVVKINARTIEDLRHRNELWQREQEMAQREMAAMRSCVTVSWRNYNQRCRIVERMKAAQRSHEEMQALLVEGLENLSRAADEFAAKQSQRRRPLSVCRASNAPNGVSVNEAALRHAAMSTKEAAPT